MESKWISDRSEFTMTMPVFSPARPSEVPSGMHDILLEELKERSWLEPNNLSSIYINHLIGWTTLQIFTYIELFLLQNSLLDTYCFIDIIRQKEVSVQPH